jgi:hypothetical protein
MEFRRNLELRKKTVAKSDSVMPPAPLNSDRLEHDREMIARIVKSAAQEGIPGRDKLRREMVRRKMAEPEFLNKVAAIDRQNSLLKQRGKVRGSVLSQQNQLSNEVIGPGEQEKGRLRGRGPGGNYLRRRANSGVDGMSRSDSMQVKAMEDMERDMERDKEQRLLEQMKRKVAENKPMPSALRSRMRGGQSQGISVLGSVFDAEAYLSEQRMAMGGGGDKMKRFQFNQAASDATPPDRFLKDYRDPM